MNNKEKEMISRVLDRILWNIEALTGDNKAIKYLTWSIRNISYSNNIEDAKKNIKWALEELDKNDE